MACNDVDLSLSLQSRSFVPLLRSMSFSTICLSTNKHEMIGAPMNAFPIVVQPLRASKAIIPPISYSFMPRTFAGHLTVFTILCGDYVAI